MRTKGLEASSFGARLTQTGSKPSRGAGDRGGEAVVLSSSAKGFDRCREEGVERRGEYSLWSRSTSARVSPMAAEIDPGHSSTRGDSSTETCISKEELTGPTNARPKGRKKPKDPPPTVRPPLSESSFFCITFNLSL